MKKKLSILAATVLACTMTTGFAACGETQKESYGQGIIYDVNIVNGSGTGVYRAGQTCTAVADAPEGMQFVGWYMGVARITPDGVWTVEEVKTSSELSYTFSVTKDTELVAKYAPRTDLCTVTVSGGSISGGADGSDVNVRTVTKGTSVTVSANENQTREFSYWVIDGSTEKITTNPYTFTVEKNTNVMCVYNRQCLVAVENGRVDGDKIIFTEGETCTVIADEAPAGQVFAYWYYENANGDEVAVSRDGTYTFTVNSSVRLKVRYEARSIVSVTGGIIVESGTTECNLVRGNICTITADLAPEGKQFKSWSIDGVEVASKGHIMTFRTTDATHSIKANYVDVTEPIATLENTTQGFNWYQPNGTIAQAAEFFRYGNPSKLFEKADYLIYYIYDSKDAEAGDYIATFYVYSTDNGYQDEFVSPDGKKRFTYQGGSGDACFMGTKVKEVDELMEYCIGENFDPEANYYFAIRQVGKVDGGNVYGNSAISPIGLGAYNRDGNKVRV